MSKIFPLFSSSKGNCTYIGTSSNGILIDAGVSAKKLISALNYNSLSINSVNAIFITHEHCDHIKALSVLTKKHNIPIYAKPKTMQYLTENNMIYSDSFSMSEDICVADMKISSFSTPHDAAESCGYKIHMPDGRTCAVCTDLGYVTDEIENSIYGCDAVILEANYDEKMLIDGPYPYYLKQRIKSNRGHLSNDCSGKFARKLIEKGTTRLILGHLSQENNTPLSADKTVTSYLTGFSRNRDYTLQTAPVETSGECLIF